MLSADLKLVRIFQKRAIAVRSGQQSGFPELRRRGDRFGRDSEPHVRRGRLLHGDAHRHGQRRRREPGWPRRRRQCWWLRAHGAELARLPDPRGRRRQRDRHAGSELHRPPDATPRGHRDALQALRISNRRWTYASPSAEIGPGERTGRFRIGRHQLLFDDSGRSRISYEDFAFAILDEIEWPHHIQQRFTVGY